MDGNVPIEIGGITGCTDGWIWQGNPVVGKIKSRLWIANLGSAPRAEEPWRIFSDSSQFTIFSKLDIS